jgi:transcriptional regulator GlxA family with amidase domain
LNSGVHLAAKEQHLFDLVVDVFLRGCRPQAEKEVIPESIDWLKKCLGQDLHQDRTLLSLAEELTVNPYTLLRRFKAATGITPHAYRMNCRIEQARQFLSQGKDIAETALECGFFDQSHLHRHFKAATTVTPQEYRVNFIQYLE